MTFSPKGLASQIYRGASKSLVGLTHEIAPLTVLPWSSGADF